MRKSTLDLSHLIPASRSAAGLSNQERMSRIRADRWIGYPRARAVLERLEELFTWPDKQRMPNALIIGPTNNGKSMIVEKFRRGHPIVKAEPVPGTLEDLDDPETYERHLIPVVVMQMPAEPAVVRFHSVLMAATAWTPYLPQRTRVVELERTALERLQSVKAQMLVIDELHNVLAGKSDVRREFLNLLRFLGNQLRIPIVGVGTSDAYLAIRSNDQLENRFEPLPIPKWQEGQDLESLLASFAAALPLRRPSEIATPDMARYILARTEGTIGEIAKLLTLAAIEAVNTGEECINARTLDHAGYQSPTERRRAFERALL